VAPVFGCGGVRHAPASRAVQRGPSRIRTGDGGFAIRPTGDAKAESISTSDDDEIRFARRFARLLAADADLSRIVEAWASLPAHIKAAVLALVGVGR